ATAGRTCRRVGGGAAARTRGRADRLGGRRAAVDREPVAAVPAGRKVRLGPREHAYPAAEPPPAAGELVGDVVPADRGGRVRRADRDAPSEDDAPPIAERQETGGARGRDAVAR